MTGDWIVMADLVVPILQPFLEIRDGRHPCLSRTVSGSDFIPNDVVIRVDDVSSA